MFRKRKQPTPHFRLPPPFNPLTGQFAPFVPDRKDLCLFSLDEALATTDASKDATIVAQYGDGSAHGQSAIVVYNTPTATEDVYLWAAASGDYGYAFYDNQKKWRLL